MAVQPPYSPNTVNQTVDYGGATWKGDPGTGWHLATTDPRHGNYMAAGVSSGGSLSDIINAAKELNTWQAEQNKPVIASIEAQRQPLIDRYQALLDQITGNQKTAERRQEISTSGELGRRGISAQGGLFGQTLTDALNPITQQYTNLYKETGAGRESDLLSLARMVKELQAGQPSNAVSQALQFGGYQQQAQATAANIANMQAQQQYNQQQLSLAQATLDLETKKWETNPWGL